MISILGTYECKADAKGRVMLPSGLKKQVLPVLDDGFVIKRSVFNKCLEIHPMSEWKKIVDQVNQLNRFVKKNNDFIRRYTAGVRIVDLDNSGRILIPKDLLKSHFSKNELVLTSAINIIEIWDKKLYEDVINDSQIDFEDLSESVMGNAINDVS